MTNWRTSHVEVVHALTRRVRVITPALRRDAERCFTLEILLRKHEAVRAVRVTPGIGSVVVRFDPHRLPLVNLVKLIDTVVGNLGRQTRRQRAAKAAIDGPVAEVNVAIEGMTCASCAALIQLALRRDPRVRDASVNYAAQSATIVGQVERPEIERLVGSFGYTARPMDTLTQRRLVVERERLRLAEARRRALVAGLLSLPVLAIGMAMPQSWPLRLLEFALTTPVVLRAGRPFFERAWKLAQNRTANMDTLIAIGAGAAYSHSVVSMLAGRHHLYFEAAAGIVSFVLFGRWLEERARGKASEAVRALVDLQPPTATAIRGGVEMRLPVDDVVIGDVAIVRPGERIPIDGVILAGLSTVDESMLTGESMPVVRQTGDKVAGGCINGNGSLRLKVTATGADTVLAGIVRMVDHAQASKLPIQRMADRVSEVFVPGVVAVAGFIFLGWLFGGRSIAFALDSAVSVLLIACPCALGLATPTAIMAATGRAARNGIFVRDGEALETASRISVLLFDKTGTITEGRPVVTDFQHLDDQIGEIRLLELIAGAESGSEHHLARALVDFARQRAADAITADKVTAIAGQGIRARVDGHDVLIGNAAILESAGVVSSRIIPQAEAYASRGRTPVLIAVDGRLAAVCGITDRPRASVAPAIAALRDIGVRAVMVTGDVEDVARRIAAEVGITEVIASASPARKQEIVTSLRERGETVGMIGDGINDAPALAAADVGFAVGSGTDIAIEAAPVTIIGGDIAKVADMIILSRRTMRVVHQNLIWAMGYNTIAIPGAAMGRLSPMIASSAMALSSVSVVMNSLRLQKGGGDA